MKPILVGIDVSAKTLDVAIDTGRGPVAVAQFDNTATGHRALVRKLTKGGRHARVVVEATGVYHLDLALALHGAVRVEVMVANPLSTRSFARAELRRSKTDRTDAQSLLEFVRAMRFRSWNPPAPEILELRAISRHMAALTRSSKSRRAPRPSPPASTVTSSTSMGSCTSCLSRRSS